MKYFPQRLRSGSTGVAVLLTSDWLTVSWLGDSQAVLVRQGEPVTLMDPHKPEREVRHNRRDCGCIGFSSVLCKQRKDETEEATADHTLNQYL